MRLELGQQNGKEVPNVRKIALVAAADRAAVGEQPCGKPARVPLRADIRSRTHDGIEPDLLRKAQKPPDVAHPRKTEFSLSWFVHIPRDIRFDSVEAARL